MHLADMKESIIELYLNQTDYACAADLVKLKMNTILL